MYKSPKDITFIAIILLCSVVSFNIKNSVQEILYPITIYSEKRISIIQASSPQILVSVNRGYYPYQYPQQLFVKIQAKQNSYLSWVNVQRTLNGTALSNENKNFNITLRQGITYSLKLEDQGHFQYCPEKYADWIYPMGMYVIYLTFYDGVMRPNEIIGECKFIININDCIPLPPTDQYKCTKTCFK